MHRVHGGWHSVGQMALDDADVTGALAQLRAVAQTLEPGGVTTKILIPNDQIKYIALDTTRADDADVRAALDGATPYSVDELAYDFAKGGGRTYIAAVARETLIEAQEFAAEHGFDPIGFAAVPDPFTFVGEAYFGAVAGKDSARDGEAVVVIGRAAVPPASRPDVSVQPPKKSPETDADSTGGAHSAVAPPRAPDSKDDSDPIFGPQPRRVKGMQKGPEPAPPVQQTAPDEAPLFTSRLRAERSPGAAETSRKAAAQGSSDDGSRTAARREPTLAKAAPPGDPAPLAVPTERGSEAMPPLAAPDRTAFAPAATPLTTAPPDPVTAPPVTGDAATTLAPDVAASTIGASLIMDPDGRPDMENEPPSRSATANALGAANAIGGAVGGMFASHRLANPDTQANNTPDMNSVVPDEKSRLTVFGARKKSQPKHSVGGKPRFLGLILTAVLLLFMLVMAAFAALSEDGFARWFGFGASETRMAQPVPPPDPAMSDVAARPVADETASDLRDGSAAGAMSEDAQVLTPEEAQRVYAATGVWQRAPRISTLPRTTTLDAMILGTPPRAVLRTSAGPLSSASSVAGDALIATPVDPPAPDTVFDFNADGLVVATPEGALTPDRILVIAGPPPLLPPTRPGTTPPALTPQDQIAAVVPETAQTPGDAPEGVVLIFGRPAIAPPVRGGTPEPVQRTEGVATPSADAAGLAGVALQNTDGLLANTAMPPVLPAAQPQTGTAGGTQTETTNIVSPEGLNLIAGPPPILPPTRPATLTPQDDAALDTSIQSIETAQTPTLATRRPFVRPAALIDATGLDAEEPIVSASAPVLGALTPSQAAAFRPTLRPAGLAPATAPEPQPEPAAVVQQAAVQTPTLQLTPEIAAAVAAAASRPNPIVNPTAQAIARSGRPDTRPRNMARIVERANAANQRAAPQVAVASVAPRTVAPSGPTTSAVAQNATLQNAMNLRDVNLMGIYGSASDRRALVRLGNGRFVRVTVGDTVDGGRVTAISANALSYTKRGRAITLEVAG